MNADTNIEAMLPPDILLDALLREWLLEDIGRGDRATQALFDRGLSGAAQWVVKEAGTIAGLPIAARVFKLLNPTSSFTALVAEGEFCEAGTLVARIEAPVETLLMGERVALNLAMRLSGIATATRKYVDRIADLPVRLVDTRKTTPGLRLLEKYAVGVGGGLNHRMGLVDAAMLKDNHIQAAGDIQTAVARVRARIPYPLTIEVETSTLAEVRAAIAAEVDIIMLDNMSIERMTEAVQLIRFQNPRLKIEASGNVTLETLRAIAETGVDYISTSAPITRSTWLDLSMKML